MELPDKLRETVKIMKRRGGFGVHVGLVEAAIDELEQLAWLRVATITPSSEELSEMAKKSEAKRSITGRAVGNPSDGYSLPSTFNPFSTQESDDKECGTGAD